MYDSDMNKDIAENEKSRPGAKESNMHQGTMNSVRPQKTGSTAKVWTN